MQAFLRPWPWPKARWAQRWAAPTHTYTTAGNYSWSLTFSVQSGVSTVTTNVSGIISITEPVSLSASLVAGQIQLAWPLTPAEALLEKSGTIAPDARWMVSTNVVSSSGGQLSILVPNQGNHFFRLRKL